MLACNRETLSQRLGDVLCWILDSHRGILEVWWFEGNVPISLRHLNTPPQLEAVWEGLGAWPCWRKCVTGGGF